MAVCLASGINDEALVGGMGEVFAIGEGPGDRPIVWSGGTSASAAYNEPMVIEEDHLVFVRTAHGSPLLVWDGYQGVDPATGGKWGASGCGDIDGNGEEEFVQVVGTIAGDQLNWTRSTWALDGSTANSRRHRFRIDAPTRGLRNPRLALGSNRRAGPRRLLTPHPRARR